MKWEPHEVEVALEAIRTATGNKAQAAALATNRTQNSVRKYLSEYHRERYEAALQGKATTPVARARHGDDMVPEWLERLRPVHLPAPPQHHGRLTTASQCTLVAGDFHFPKADEATVTVLFKTLEELRPQTLVLNGDTVDLLAVSHYSKDQRHTWTLRDEAEAFHAFLHEVQRIGNRWGLRIVETEANHSGNGVASRWHRYLSERIPVLYSHPKAEELLNYRAWWYPEWSSIQLVDEWMICDSLLITHGDIVRKNPAYSARAHAEKYHASVMHSHTHRMGMGIDRIPSVGSRAESHRRSYEIGCMCDTNPTYATAPNWTNGFAIVVENGDDYNVELVPVLNGAAVVTTLETTVRA